MDILSFRLKGAAQSWSTNNIILKDKYTEDFPTKSAIAGLLGTALGLSIEDTPEYFKNIKLAVRKDKIGTYYTDFQTTRYNNQLQKDGNKYYINGINGDVYITAEGVNNRVATYIEYNKYLMDSEYTICISGDINKLNEISNALKHPADTLFLGKKTCLPTAPIKGTIYTEYSSLEEAIENITTTNTKDEYIWYEIDDVINGRKILYDEPADFINHKYEQRRVRIDRFKNKNYKEGEASY